MRKKVKIFLHHEIYQTANTRRPFNVREFVRAVMNSILSAIFEIFYSVGLILVALIFWPSKVFKQVTAPNPNNIASFNWLKGRYPTRSVAIFALIAFLSVGMFQSLNLVASGVALKGRILGDSDQAINYLLQAKSQIEIDDYTSAQSSFNSALASFENIEIELKRTNSTISTAIELLPPAQQATGLIQAAQLVSQAGSYSVEALALMRQTTFGPQGIITPNSPKEDIENLIALITKTKSNIATASDLMNKVNAALLPQSFELNFVQARDLLNSINANTNALFDLLLTAEHILLGQKNVLLIFQNNNELRPTGGFMGTIGSAKLQDGVIKDLDIRTVYDYDGQLTEKILPPEPYLAVTDRLYLRDSNWQASFEDSAKQITTFFEKEGGETPDLVIALTPQLIIDLLKLTGPIEMPAYDIVLTSENFIEVTQETTSENYDRELNQPKQMLADFFPVLLQEISNEKTSLNLFALLQVLHNNLSQKHILIFSRNENLQSKFRAYNWAGGIPQTTRDYLQINSSNLSGSKSDLFIDKAHTLSTEINDSGEIINTVTYTLNNRMPQSSVPNISFVRFLVPKGSKLLSAENFSEVSIPLFDKSTYKRDATVSAWEQTIMKQSISGTMVGTESDKTFFGNWVRVAGGQEVQVTIRYQLPFHLKDLDNHSLLVQKQPGTNPIKFEYRVSFSGRQLLWQNFRIEQPELLDNRKLQINTELLTDEYYGLIFGKNVR